MPIELSNIYGASYAIGNSVLNAVVNGTVDTLSTYMWLTLERFNAFGLTHPFSRTRVGVARRITASDKSWRFEALWAGLPRDIALYCVTLAVLLISVHLINASARGKKTVSEAW